jgi:phage-related protein
MTIATDRNISDTGAFVEQLNNAIRENPVSAGFLGLGILWMIFGEKKIASFSNVLPSAVRYVTDGVRSASEGAGAAATGTARKIDEAVQHASHAAKEGAEGAVDTIILAKADASRTAVQVGRQIGNSVQKNFAVTLEEQPLLLGILGAGIGAGIASMFSSTAAEQELAGGAATKVKEQFRDIASQAGLRAEQVFDDVKREGINQGFTAENASESLKNAADKVRAATVAAKESIQTSSL